MNNKKTLHRLFEFAESCGDCWSVRLFSPLSVQVAG